MYQVQKRNGKNIEFDIRKIADAVKMAFEAQEKQYNQSIIDFIALKVTADFEPKIKDHKIAVEDIQSVVYKLKEKNIGILITDHNAPETLSITDRAYLLFEGRILFQGTPEELAENPVVREKYLGTNFVLRRKDFQLEEKLRAERAAQ